MNKEYPLTVLLILYYFCFNFRICGGHVRIQVRGLILCPVQTTIETRRFSRGRHAESIAKLEAQAMQMQLSNGSIFETSGAPTFLRGVLMVISRRLCIVALVLSSLGLNAVMTL